VDILLLRSATVSPRLLTIFSLYSNSSVSLSSLPMWSLGWSRWKTVSVRKSRWRLPSLDELKPVAASIAVTLMNYVESHLFLYGPVSTRTSSVFPLIDTLLCRGWLGLRFLF
jgi:hypothetical protein